MGSGDYLKTRFPSLKIGAGEALQCPTLLRNGFGAHRIEGIGDKHVPWVHNLRHTDMVVDLDDGVVLRLLRLFNESAGRNYLQSVGVPAAVVGKLDLLGISGIANVLGAIKMAKYYEYSGNDVIFTVATDSMEMYGSRIREMRTAEGEYTALQAAVDFEGRLLGLDKDDMLELSYYDRKRMHNLKYFTWVEQQGKTVSELNAQWYAEDYWPNQLNQAEAWDARIEEFNARTGVIREYV